MERSYLRFHFFKILSSLLSLENFIPLNNLKIKTNCFSVFWFPIVKSVLVSVPRRVSGWYGRFSTHRRWKSELRSWVSTSALPRYTGCVCLQRGAQCALMHHMYLFVETVRHEQSPRRHGCHICVTKCSHLQTQQNMGGEYIFLLSDRFIGRLVSINI